MLVLQALDVPALARNRKGDKLLAEGKQAEDRKQYDRALELYEQALSREPGDASYQLAVRRVRFQAGQAHVDLGQKLREQGDLEKALAEFQKAYAIDPASSIAQQELKRTYQMIEREKRKATTPGADMSSDTRSLTPTEYARRETQQKLSQLQGVPELKPLNPQVQNLKMNNQPTTVLYDTLAKLSGLNVVFDQEVRAQSSGRFTVDLSNTTIEQALDYLGTITKTFWKPLSPNTIFVTLDNPNKRRDYEDQTVKVFYLQNTTSPQEVTEISTALRTIIDLRRVFVYNAQNAILVRGSADQVALAEKLVYDMDKPKGEVVIDVVVMEASRSRTRDLAATLSSGGTNGLSIPIGFTPRNPILSGTTGTTTTTTDTSTGSTSTTTTGTTGTTGTTTTGSTTSSLISLAQIGRISTNDFSLTLPGALFSLVATDSRTRVLQSPQVRAVDNQKAILKIGDRVPIATGSFQPGLGSVGTNISPLVSTQFNYQDVGVNVDIQPHLHGGDEVSLHVDMEVSSVRGYTNIGGIQQPIIGQRKITHDVRMREGEVNVLAGLIQAQDTKSNTGLPGLVKVPFLRAILGEDKLDKSDNELLIALIPHIVRTSDINQLNMKGIVVGNDTTVQLRSVRTEPATTAAPAAPAAAVPNPAAIPPTTAPITMPATTSGGPAGVALTPPLSTVPVSAPITLTLSVNNVTDLSAAAPLRITFDKNVVNLQDVRLGGMLGGATPPSFTKNILNDRGEATVVISRPPNTPGANGSGPLLTFVFQAVAKGSTVVTLPEITLRNSKGEPIVITPPSATVNVQ